MLATLSERILGLIAMRKPTVIVVNSSQLMRAQIDFSFRYNKDTPTFHLSVVLSKQVNVFTFEVVKTFVIERYKTPGRTGQHEKYGAVELVKDNPMAVLTKHQVDIIQRYMQGFLPMSSNKLAAEFRRVNNL